MSILVSETVRSAEHEVMPTDKSQRIIQPDYHNALQTARTRVLDNEDLDVFSDGTEALGRCIQFDPISGKDKSTSVVRNEKGRSTHGCLIWQPRARIAAAMLYVDHFDTVDDRVQEKLVIHRHGPQPGRALLVLIHGLGGKRYGTWTDTRDDPTKSGLGRFLYEDIPGLDIGFYAYVSAASRLFHASVELDKEAKVLADLIRELTDSYPTLILAGHSMGGLLAKVTIGRLIQRPDNRQVLSTVRALLLLATPQAGSLRVPWLLWNATADTRALRPHNSLVTTSQELFTDWIITDPTPSKSSAFLIPRYAIVAANDEWVDEFSAGLTIESGRLKNVSATHTSAVKPRNKQDDAYQWLCKRLTEVVDAASTEVGARTGHSGEDPLAFRETLIATLQSAFTHDALALQFARLGMSLPKLASAPASAYREIVQWALPRNAVLRALIRMMAEERPDNPRVRGFMEKHPQYSALLTGEERELVRQALVASVASYSELSKLAFDAMVLSLDDLLPQTPTPDAPAEPHVPALIRAADWLGYVESLLNIIVQRFPGPVIDGKLRPLVEVVRSRRTNDRKGESPFDACEFQGKLFINRTMLRNAMRDLTSDDGKTRILAIKGPTRSGMTYSKYFIEHIERLGKYDKVLISLEDETPGTFGPEALAEAVLSKTEGIQKPIAPKAAWQTETRWIKAIANQVVSHVKTRPRPVLIVLDRFTDPTLSAQTKELVKELIRSADLEERVRIALLDYNNDLLPTDPGERFIVEPIPGFTRDDIRAFFVKYAHVQSRPEPTDAALELLVKEVAVVHLGGPERNEAVALAIKAWTNRLRMLP